jgi:Fe2+ transport system protein FeoA
MDGPTRQVARALLCGTYMKMNSIFSIGLDGAGEAIPARIVALEAAGEDQARLEAMGLCVGRTVEVVQRGDPMIVRVLGTRIGIAAALAAAVRIEARSGG